MLNSEYVSIPAVKSIEQVPNSLHRCTSPDRMSLSSDLTPHPRHLPRDDGLDSIDCPLRLDDPPLLLQQSVELRGHDVALKVESGLVHERGGDCCVELGGMGGGKDDLNDREGAGEESRQDGSSERRRGWCSLVGGDTVGYVESDGRVGVGDVRSKGVGGLEVLLDRLGGLFEVISTERWKMTQWNETHLLV